MANYQITDTDDLSSGGAKTKARKNIAAIQLLKEIEAAQRPATPEEQAVLIRYSGWGVAADIFTTKPEWTELRSVLEATLTEGEFAAARASTINAFYTDIDIAAEIYQGVERLGFTGGTILDPSMGATGAFEGTLPTAIASNSQVTGIELDSISGRIASQLYPDSDIYVQGFQDVALADNYFDLTISNVPFSEIGVSDPRYKNQSVNTLHDYFFAKGLDKLRPGGLLVYITSTGTMQSAKGQAFRQYLSDRANLVGAMRLPGDAFKKNAGTEVTTDLIILQKLGSGVVPNGIAWTELKETNIQDNDGKLLKTNEYYAQRPALMLGELSDDKLYPGRLALKGDGRNISEAIRQAFAAMPPGIYQERLEPEAETQRILVPPELQSKAKQNGRVVHNGELMIRIGDYLEPSGLTGKPYERVIGLIKVRDAVQKVFDVQLKEGTDEQLEAAQAKLIAAYDRFVSKHGYVSQGGNKLVYNGDPDYPLLRALEKYDPEEKTAQKTDIFFKRTIQAYQPKTHAESAKEGLLFSLNELGKVDTDYIARLTSQSKPEVVLELQKESLIFRDPVADVWQTQGEYLSGNVKEKLAIAQEAATKDSQFTVNVEALQDVQPEPLLPGDIDVRLGSVWVPSTEVEAFAYELLGIEDGLSIKHSPSANAWYVTSTYEVRSLEANTIVYGTENVAATKLIELSLNLQNPTVYTDHPSEPNQRIVDQDATAAARLKQEGIKEKFKDWIWQDPDRTDRLTNLYNAKFNTNRERQYDGSHLELPGKNPNFVLRKHQTDAVYRSLAGNMLLAHVVGAGKTAEMICSAMEQKRLGLANKPMFVVPNHLLEQMAGDIKHLYPTANILAATKKDSAAANRQQLMARIATGQWDAVVVTHTAFEKLKLSEQAQTNFLAEGYAKVREAILSVKGRGEESRRVMKDLEKKKSSLQERINEIAQSPAKDNTITFEQLGVDLLLVDESHYFKNLGYVTKMRSIAGLPNTESKRAFDMHMKVRYMAEVRGEGKGVIFATGTPIANSMAELYTVQRYLQPKELGRMGLASFDDWASVFGETVTSAELAATGKFQVRTRFSSFVNLPELMSSVRQVMDIQTADMLKLPVPELVSGKPTVIAVPATDDQLAYMDELVKRAENMRNVDPTEDNMLKLTGNGRSASADMRLLFPEAFDDPDSKINRFVSDAYQFWQESKGEKTHLVFCDLGTPKKAGEFSIYQDIKEKLIDKGVPAKAIAFAQDYKTDANKLKLQQDFNKGKISILISGAQLETGFNGQRRLARISHLTVPWRPDQIEQRDGRMVRQGNQNAVVESIRYVTQGRNDQPGIDGYFWQTLENKAGFISQVMKGSSDVRRMSDISTEALSYSEIKAIATGNPLIMEKATLDNTIRQLSAQSRAHTNSNYQIRNRLKKLPVEIDRLTEALRRTQIDSNTAKAALSNGTVQLFGQTLALDQEEEIGKRIRSQAAFLNKSQEPVSKQIGALGGFNLYLQNEGLDGGLGTRIRISGEKHYYYKDISRSKSGAYSPLKRLLERDVVENLNDFNKQLANRQKDLSDLSGQLEQTFPKEKELAVAIQRLAEVHEALKADSKREGVGQSTAGIDDGSSATGSLSQPRVAPQEQQTTGVTERIAKFIAAVGLEREVLSKDGFYLTLQHADKDNDLVIDAEDGKQIKLTANVQIANLPQAKTTAIFQVDDAGILTLESIQAEGDFTADEDILAARLALYLSTNQYAHQAQSLKAETKEPIHNVTTENQGGEKGSALDELVEAITPELIGEAEQQTVDTNGVEKGRVAPVEEESVVLRIKSLFSGREEEIVLPPIERITVSQPQTVETRKDDKLLTVSADHSHLLKTDSKSQADDLHIYQSDHITVSRNPAQEGIEVRFTEKPSKEWTQQLSAQKFRFSKKGGDPRWYRKESNVFVSLLTSFAEKYTQAVAVNDQQVGAIAPTDNVQQPISSQTIEQTTSSVKAQPDKQESPQAEKTTASKADDAIRPAFKRYLEWKEQYPDSVVLIKTPGTYFETYKEDAVLVADSLKVMISSVPSKSPQHGRVNLSRVFPTGFDALVERLQKTTLVVAVEADNTTTIHPRLEKETEQASSGLVSIGQSDRTERAAPQDPLTPGESRHESDRTFATAEAIQQLQDSLANQPNLDDKQSQHSDGLAVAAAQLAQDTEERSLNLESISPATSTQFEQLQQAGQGLASVVIQQALELRDPKLHATLTNEGATASLEVKQLQNWYADIPAQQVTKQSDQHEIVAEVQQSLDLEGRQPIPIAQADTRRAKPQMSISAVPALDSIHAEKQPPAGEKLASAVVQQAIKLRDPKLHAALTGKEATVPVEVGQLRDWYAAVQAQQSSKLSEQLKAIVEKGKQAKELEKPHLTFSEAEKMTADIDRFSKSQPKTTVGELRTWYRANAAISQGSHAQNIQKIALRMKETSQDSYQLRPADYVRMEREVKAFQFQIAREIEPSLRSIWELAVSNELVTQESNGNLAFAGVNYSITSAQDGTLTLTHKQTSSEMSLAMSGEVIKNELTLDDAKMLRTISEKLMAASKPEKMVSMQV
ncbi:MAG: hypothetical protein DCF25_02410 [Leptolyngbya foveolarum]|uniref:Helicase C-terminal domain-containing protein n=1 Tax=Leptolyngbya foveolarum TaxID=47253 RepID=A0A2W4UMJ4_9CYAN|nr:MAG: hypothetical protein DCF25_02410 [Leptolyngbya foveolarum]